LVPPPLVLDEVESLELEGRPLDELLSPLVVAAWQLPSLWQVEPLGQ
jgi:hypothetical protein